MNIDKTTDYFNLLIEKSCDSHLIDMWLATHYDANNNDIEDLISFSDRKEVFFWLLEGALESGQLRLMKNREYLEGSPKELVQRFRDVFPKADVPNTKDDMRFWFYGDPPDPCPAIAVWRYEHPDGRVQWMPCP